MSLFFDPQGGVDDPAVETGDELGSWPDRGETRPVRASRWFCHTPRDRRLHTYEAANPSEAAAAAGIASSAIEQAQRDVGKAGRLKARIEVYGRKALVTLRSSGGGHNPDLESAVLAEIEAAWEDAFNDGVLTMKPERTQLGITLPEDDPPGPTPWYLEICDVTRVRESSYSRVRFHQTLLARYTFADAEDAVQALVVGVMQGSAEEPSTLVKAIVVGKTVYFRLSSKVSQTLTEVEYDLAYAIEEAIGSEETAS